MTVFEAACKAAGVPVPDHEYQFCPDRKWRADFCWRDPYLIILEIEGGAWSRGRHVRGRGFVADLEKYNTAAIMGYRIIRVTPQQFDSGEALELVMRCIESSRVTQ